MDSFKQRASREIRNLLAIINDENYDVVIGELSEYIEHGTEESILLVETCLDHFKIYKKDLKSMHLEPVVASLYRKLMEKPHFSKVFSGIMRHTTISEEFLDNLSNALKLSAYEKLVFGLSLSESEINDVRMAGTKFCMAQFVELLATHASVDPVYCIMDVLRFLGQSEVLSKHVDSFIQMILQVWLNANSGFILASLHSDQLRDSKNLSHMDFLMEGNDNNSDANHVETELDYKCTGDVPQCEETAASFTITRILGSRNQLAHHCGELRLRGIPLPDEAAFSLLMSCYRNACQDPWPLAAVCGNVWKNTEAQLFLKHAITASPEVCMFSHSRRQLEHADAVNDHTFQADHASHSWLCVGLLEVLCELAERGHATSVRSMLEFPLKHCPEVLLLGMAHVITAHNLLQHEVSSAVLPMLLKDASMSGILLHLWRANPLFFSRALNHALTLDPDNMIRVVDLFQELQILTPVLDLVAMSLGIRLAALALHKEFIDLEEWLSTNLSTYEDIFFEECLRFLKEVEVDAQELSAYGEIWSLYKEAAPTFLKVLPLHAGLLSSKQLSEELKSFYVMYMHHSPRMKTIDGPDSSTSEVYADHIETEVNFYFQQMFSGQLTVGAMVQMLTQFKGSSEKREQSIFECMINNLFEVYKFFNRYSDEQLTIAAVLFGLLIRHQLVTQPTLDFALKAVSDALHEPADSKMFVSGTKILENCVDRLIEWPEYCQKILQISHLRVTHSELVLLIEQTLARTSTSHPESDEGHNPGTDQHHGSITPANVEMSASSFPLTAADGARLQQRNKSHLDERRKASLTSSSHTHPDLSQLSASGQVSVATSSGSVSIQKPQSVVRSSAATASSPGFSSQSRARFGSALRIGTLISAAERREPPIEAPPSDTQDKISFMINNLSIANIEAKAKEFAKILEEQYYPWFAQNMVMRRVSIEPNFHMLYLTFLEKANSKHLNNEIVRATYENCKVLLRSELIKSSAEERSLLKNLGGWLGKITIGRNRVLLSREIDPKSLIMEAYEKGLMIGMIPFISKILEPCQNSLAYQPPNPWTMGILGLLAEIYAMPNLKANLKFEIEVLFKNLNLYLKSVTPTSLLKDMVRQTEGNPDFSNKDVGPSQQHIVEVNSTVRSAVIEAELPPVAAGQSYQGGRPHILYQHAGPLNLPVVTWGEDEEMATLGLSNQLPLARGRAVTQLPFPDTQLPAPAPAPTSNLLQQVNANLELQPFLLHFQSVLPLAMDKAVKEIVSSIVQRSAFIATQTAMELILKEYDTESDENCIHKASCLMVVQLAGNLAYVTGKEPLRTSISAQLRNLLQGLNFASEFLEYAIQCVVDDNLDLGCASIEKAATDKGLIIVERELAQQLSIRRKHSSLRFCSASSSHTVMADDSCPHNFGNEGGLPSFPSVPAPQWHELEPSNGAKVTNHRVVSKDDNIASESSETDPPGFHRQVSMLFVEWCRIHALPGVNDAAYAHFVVRLHQNVLSKSDDMQNRFFRRILEVAVSHCLSFEGFNSGPLSLHQQANPSSFLAIDVFSDLIFSIMKFFTVDHGSNNLSLLSKVLTVTVKFIKKDAEEKKTLFNARPYFRLFVNFLLHRSSVDSIIDDANLKVLTALSSSFHALQPMKVPAFSFAWLQLISHKDFMPNLLTANAKQGWPYFERLVVDMLQFMEPFLRTGELGEPVRLLYKGTVKVLLVVLHDYPEFLCYYYFSFCDVIAPRCIQLRNIFLSAFPRNMRIPDPNTPNLKVDLLAEMSQSPCILSEFDAALKANKMKSDVDEYLTMRPEVSPFLSELKHKLLLSPSEAERCGTCYNVPLMNSLVLYVGTQAIQQLQASTASHATSIARCVSLSIFFGGAALDIFQTLILDLDSEGCYYFFNAVANQLRYPNNHTHYFSFIMLYFFSVINQDIACKQEAIQEVITRVLLERLMAHRPHPWGVVVTFLELVKNPRYNFWDLSFTRCAPEIERIFDSVSRSCEIPRPEDSGSGVAHDDVR